MMAYRPAKECGPQVNISLNLRALYLNKNKTKPDVYHREVEVSSGKIGTLLFKKHSNHSDSLIPSNLKIHTYTTLIAYLIAYLFGCELVLRTKPFSR